MERYFGSYQKIEPSSKKEGALLLSADNIIGDSYEIIFDGDLAWAKNRFGARVGHFTIDFSRQLRVLNARGWKFIALLSLVAQIGTHVVVKPATEGSSIGISIVDTREALEEAISEAFEHDSEIVVEKFVRGREFTVAVIGNDEPRALPIIEIIAQKGEFYDFESKYAAGGSRHICPAELSEEDAETIKREAVAAHKALSCEGVSRTDFILDDEGKPWALETNTIAGMTETSLLPDAAAAAGIPFPQLCTMLIEYALERSGR